MTEENINIKPDHLSIGQYGHANLALIEKVKRKKFFHNGSSHSQGFFTLFQ